MLKLLLGDPNFRKQKRYQPNVSDINLLEEVIAPLSDEGLPRRTAELRTSAVVACSERQLCRRGSWMASAFAELLVLIQSRMPWSPSLQFSRAFRRVGNVSR